MLIIYNGYVFMAGMLLIDSQGLSKQCLLCSILYFSSSFSYIWFYFCPCWHGLNRLKDYISWQSLYYVGPYNNPENPTVYFYVFIYFLTTHCINSCLAHHHRTPRHRVFQRLGRRGGILYGICECSCHQVFDL